MQPHTQCYMPKVIRDMGLAVVSFDRAHEPGGVSTMEWGTRTAVDTNWKRYNRVPDVVVYDLGAVGKEPIIRLLARRACGCGWDGGGDCGGVGGGVNVCFMRYLWSSDK